MSGLRFYNNRSFLGKIAFYMRLYRSIIRHPQTGNRGFIQYFPDPPVQFHPWVYYDCAFDIEVFC